MLASSRASTATTADLQSTNGSLCQRRATSCTSSRTAILHVAGNCIYRFPGGRQRRGRVPRRDLPPDHHQKPYPLTDPQQALPARLPRPRAGPVGRYRRPLALILFDIDPFQGECNNNLLAYLGGDFTLRKLAACVKGCFSRYSSKEFCVVLPETTHKGACRSPTASVPWWTIRSTSTRTSRTK